MRSVGAGFEAMRFEHRALPEIDLADVDIGVEFFGRRLRAPLLIACMTGGTPEAMTINRRLAQVAAENSAWRWDWVRDASRSRRRKRSESFACAREAPDVLLLCKSRRGATQQRVTCAAIAAARRTAASRRARAAPQPVARGAAARRRHLFSRAARAALPTICAACQFPVIVKEVGWGIGPAEVRALFDAGVAAVDVAGTGGTSWSEVERHRIAEPWRARVAATFDGWGIPTAEALVQAREAAPQRPLMASGGIRSGLEVAKAIALGADLVGIAGPFLRAADRGVEAASELAQEYVEGLRIAMFCTGARTLAELRSGRLLRREFWNGPTVSDSGAELNLEAADAYCRTLTRRHYENFSVASRFVERASCGANSRASTLSAVRPTILATRARRAPRWIGSPAGATKRRRCSLESSRFIRC